MWWRRKTYFWKITKYITGDLCQREKWKQGGTWDWIEGRVGLLFEKAGVESPHWEGGCVRQDREEAKNGSLGRDVGSWLHGYVDHMDFTQRNLMPTIFFSKVLKLVTQLTNSIDCAALNARKFVLFIFNLSSESGSVPGIINVHWKQQGKEIGKEKKIEYMDTSTALLPPN